MFKYIRVGSAGHIMGHHGNRNLWSLLIKISDKRELYLQIVKLLVDIVGIFVFTKVVDVVLRIN